MFVEPTGVGFRISLLKTTFNREIILEARKIHISKLLDRSSPVRGSKSLALSKLC